MKYVNYYFYYISVDVDLPTAEELMRTILPEQDYIQGFSLQPVRLGLQNFWLSSFNQLLIYKCLLVILIVCLVGLFSTWILTNMVKTQINLSLGSVSGDME